MSQQKNKKSLDELMFRAIGRENLKFDLDKWEAHHQNEIQEFEAKAKRSMSKPPVINTMWRTIMKSRIIRSAAAAVVIAAVVLAVAAAT